MKIQAKDVRKIKNATETELETLKTEYDALLQNIHLVSTSALIMICIIGVAATVYFHNTVLNFIGLIIFAYPFYIFANREGHRDGYFEGYYEAMTKGGQGMPDLQKELSGHAAESGPMKKK